MIIAIDGPAGAGKSTIAQRLAEKLNFQLVDTGALYRAVAYAALRRNISQDNGDALASLAETLEFEFCIEDKENVLYCDGTALGNVIRRAEVSLAASVVSAHPQVRQALLQLQRRLGRQRDSILEGRDIGTVVFPDAELKFFITASPKIRAQRRVAQMSEQGMNAAFDDVYKDIVERDKRDTTRAIAPLKMADDAILVDTGERDIESVLDEILRYVQARKQD